MAYHDFSPLSPLKSSADTAIPAGIFQIPVSWPREVFLNEEDLESLIIKAVSPRATHEFGAFKR